MSHRVDSVQVVSTFGAIGGFTLQNFDSLIASACALVCLAYTLWKWRREARTPASRDSEKS